MAQVLLKDLNKKYDEVHAVKDVNLTIRDNTVPAGALFGGAVANFSALTIRNSTFVNNPKKPFKSPTTHNRGLSCVATIVAMPILPVVMCERTRCKRASRRTA